ncbi:MAG: hypothetical protein WAN72_05860 [Candidatus Acidiferrales bacterium]
MNELGIDLTNCYGIKKLSATFDFAQHRVYAICAPNGAMKSYLAHTFKDLAGGLPSKDLIFPARACTRTLTDETGAEIPKESILVVAPYDSMPDLDRHLVEAEGQLANHRGAGYTVRL